MTARASRNGNWNAEGRVITTHGYVRVRVGKDHPHADSRGWIYEHELTWRSAGRDVPAGFLIHHRNEDKTDNRLANLELKPKPDHSREHSRKQPRRRNGRFARSRRTA